MSEGKIRYLNLFSGHSECFIEGHYIKFAEITPYIDTFKNQCEISAKVSAKHGKMIIKKKIELQKGSQATIVVIEKMQKPDIIKVEEPLLFKRTDRAYVRFVNLAKTEVSVLRVNGDKVCSLLTNTAGEYFLAQEGGYVFELATKKGKKVITCRLEKENKYSLYIIDSKDYSKPDFFIYKDE